MMILILIMTLLCSRNPFAYVGWTVSEFDSVRLRNGKSLDRFLTDQSDLGEIKRQSTFRCLLFCHRFPQRRDVRTVDASTHAQDHKAIRSKNAFNFAGHRISLVSLLFRSPKTESKRGKRRAALPPRMARLSKSFNSKLCKIRCLEFAAKSRRKYGKSVPYRTRSIPAMSRSMRSTGSLAARAVSQ